MFNIFAFEKKLAQDEELKKLKEEFVAEEKRRKGIPYHFYSQYIPS